MRGKSIGIDLGTTNCCVAYYSDTPKLIEMEAQSFLPSAVTYTSNDTTHVGSDALDQLVHHPKTTILKSKRFIGLRADDPAVIRDSQLLPYEIVDDGGQVAFKLQVGPHETKTVCPVAVATLLLSKIKANAEKYFGKPVESAVVTVPAYFNNMQRAATKLAAETAGLQVLGIINEPTAAAIAYGIETDLEGDGDRGTNLLVFDLGGGTFDVSVVRVSQNDYQVLASHGDSHLGGTDFDGRIFQYVKEEMQLLYDVDISSNVGLRAKILQACEKAKKTLSVSGKAQVAIPEELIAGGYKSTITRDQFEGLCEDLFAQTKDTIESTLQSAHLNKQDIEFVVLVGGSSMIPHFTQKLLKEVLPHSKICKDINPAEAVAFGAAWLAAVRSGSVCGNVSQIKFSDVTPLTLGVETVFGEFLKVVARNTAIPVTVRKQVTTSFDFQKQINFKVFQGERAIARDNCWLGEFLLSAIPVRLRGQVNVEMVFSIDENGILHVSAVEPETGKHKHLSISHSHNLSPEKVQQIKEEALAAARQDQKSKELVDAKNKLLDYLYGIKRQYERSTLAGSRDVNAHVEAVIGKLSTQVHSLEDIQREKTRVENMAFSLQDLI